MSDGGFSGNEKLESDLWEAADNLRANSKLTSTEYDFLKVLAQNAINTLAYNKESFSAQQRAWVGVQGVEKSNGFTEKADWQITIVFFNSGRTPARRCVGGVAPAATSTAGRPGSAAPVGSGWVISAQS